MKTAIFIDGANNHSACRALGFDMDYDRLLPFFNKDKTLLRAYYYTALLPDNADGSNPLRPLLDFLAYNGYEVRTKMSKSFEDKTTGLIKVKGNMDMELAVDAMMLADRLDDIILFSGDGDFTYLVRTLQQKACRVTVVSTLLEGTGRPPMIADELRRAADNFIDLAEIIQGIHRVSPSEGRPRGVEARPRPTQR